jgi:cell division protease FtsH
MFLGRDIAAERDFSEETAATIDEEVGILVADAYRRAKQLLIDNRHVLDKIAHDLVERETVDAEELQQILETSELKLAAALSA